MKLMYLGMLFLSMSQAACASAQSGYIRVWRGFRVSGLTQERMYETLPEFMNATTQLYGGALNNYMVMIPPAEKPSFVPDEMALVAFGNEADYRRIRATPEGERYSAHHWDFFNKDNSKSLVAQISPVVPEQLVADTAYDFGEGKTDWSKGLSFAFIGLRKSSMSPEVFLQRLRDHVARFKTSFKDAGLLGYVVVAAGNYELAFVNWESQEKMERSFASEAGAVLRQESAEMFDGLQYSASTPFNGRSIGANKFYSTLGR